MILLEKAKKGPVSVKTFLTILSGRGKVLLLIFISLFFGQIPGIAIPFGLFISYLGIRIAFHGNYIWLSKNILKKRVPSSVLKKALNQALRFIKIMKRWTYPRYPWVTQHRAMRKMNGLMIALVGISLAVCPPIPLSSVIASIAIFLIGIGLLNDDAIYIMIGYGFAIVYCLSVVISLHFFSINKILELFRS